MSPIQADEREQQSKRDGDGDYQGRAKAEKHQAEDRQHQEHTEEQILLHRMCGLLDQEGAVIIGDNLDVRWQHALVQIVGQLLDAFEYYLRLLSDAHEDDAFHGLLLPHISKLAETHCVADLHLGYVAHVNRNAVVYREHDIPDVGGVAYQSQAANVVGLPAL